METNDSLSRLKLLVEQGIVRYLLTDSRSLSVADGTLFFAIVSGHGDGHRYVEELYAKGVRHFVVSHAPSADGRKWHDLCPEAAFYPTESALDTLQQLAAWHRHRFRMPVVGITGSNGKTIVKEWIHQLVSPAMAVTRSPRSYNSQIGVPLSAWLIGEHTQVAVLEAGISRVGEMARLEPIVAPGIGVLTNLGSAHQENFVNLEEKLTEKLRLFRRSAVIVYHADNELVDSHVRKLYADRRLVGWSVRDTAAPIYIYGVERDAKCTRFRCRLQSDALPQGGTIAASIPFIDEASLHNAVSALAVALLLGVDVRQVEHGLPRLSPIAMRLEVREGTGGCTLVNDSYNSDLASLDIALDFLGRQKRILRQPTTLVLSDLEQAGLSDEQLYRQVADTIRAHDVDHLIAVGGHITANRRLFAPVRTQTFPDTDTLTTYLASHPMHSRLVLLKGARRFHFERVADQLSEKQHETTLNVDLNALRNNLNHYRDLLNTDADTRMMCMIKADAYGMGAVDVAKTLTEQHVDYLAVAVADEGVALRRHGIPTDIVVMNPEMSALRTLFDYRLEPEVYSFRLLEALIEEGTREGMADFPIHIKIDTGMHRLGFHPQRDMERLIHRLKSQRVLLPRSVFTHFVGADSSHFDDFSQRQHQLFLQAADTLQGAFSHHILRHTDNTAAIEHFPQWQMDMCRLGIGLYGVSPHGDTALQTVASLCTTILQIHDVEAGETVGYGRRTVLERDSRVAAIPIGYADGLNRLFGNRNAFCMVNGKKAPYLGNICMDVSMIDVTDIDCAEGDTVEIYGAQLPVTHLAKVANTIPYELMTAVSNRVKRVYFSE